MGAVLPGFEKLSHGSRQQVSQGNPVHNHPHPALYQTGAEAVGPLGVGNHGKGRVHLVHNELFQGSRLKQIIGVNAGNPPLGLLHQLRIGGPLQIYNVHRRHTLPARKNLGNLQLWGPEPAADQGGVGPQGLHKGVLGPLQRGLVVRGAHRPLLLCGGKIGHHFSLPREIKDHTAVDQGKDRLVQGGAHLDQLGVDNALRHHAEGRLRGGLPQQLAGGQGAENVVIHPFIADLSVDEKDGGPLLRVPADEDLPLSKVRAVPKNEADVLRRQVPLEPGFLAGVGGNVLPFGADPAHGTASFLFGGCW